VARLRHPNIVTVYQSGLVGGRHFYTMEFIQGDPIDDYAALADLTPRAIVRLLIKVCRAVHHAHQNGVLHRDLNPANILVDEAGEPHVFDFGLAKDLWADADREHVPATDVGCGTLPYLSPEQAGSGDGLADVRSDVYALGLVLYELLTDMFPYPIRGAPDVVRRAIMYDEPLPLRRALAHGDPHWAPGRQTVDGDLEAIAAQALAKSKADRYQTAAEFADDLERWLARDAVAARGRSRLYRLRKSLRRHKVAVGFTGVVLAAVAITVACSTYYGLQARAERDRARVQRDNARRAARMAYDLFDLTLTDVEEAVRPLAGGVAVRDRLVNRLADRLPELGQLTAADGQLEQVATHLLEKQGDIALQQGRHSEALGYYQKFLDNSLNAASSDVGGISVAERPAAVVRAYRKLAEASDDPLPSLERGRDFGESALRASPGDAAARYELCLLMLGLESNLQNAGRDGKAVAYAERVLELCQAVDQQPPVVKLRWQRIQAEALTARGLILHKLGQGDAAREAVEQGLALRERIVASNSADTEARFALLWSYSHLGTLLRDAGELEQAKDYLRKAGEQGEVLALMDPSSTAWASDRYGVHHRLASLCIDTGDLSEARRESDKALAIAERLVSLEDTDSARATLYFALMLKGKVCRSEGNWQAASQCHETALATAEQLLLRNPGSPDMVERVVNACDALAFCAKRLGSLSVALANRQRACALQEELFELQPERTDRELNFVQAQVYLAGIQAECGTSDGCAEASRLLAQAEERLESLHASGKLVGLERRYHQLTEVARNVGVLLGDSVSDATESRAARLGYERP
jgi:tetratricopeptide (TPR) repeat protein